MNIFGGGGGRLWERVRVLLFSLLNWKNLGLETYSSLHANKVKVAETCTTQTNTPPHIVCGILEPNLSKVCGATRSNRKELCTCLWWSYLPSCTNFYHFILPFYHSTISLAWHTSIPATSVGCPVPCYHLHPAWHRTHCSLDSVHLKVQPWDRCPCQRIPRGCRFFDVDPGVLPAAENTSSTHTTHNTQQTSFCLGSTECLRTNKYFPLLRLVGFIVEKTAYRRCALGGRGGWANIFAMHIGLNRFSFWKGSLRPLGKRRAHFVIASNPHNCYHTFPGKNCYCHVSNSLGPPLIAIRPIDPLPRWTLIGHHGEGIMEGSFSKGECRQIAQSSAFLAR